MFEVDLHGQNSFEARINVQVFLTECIVNRQKLGRISHGYGEGILQKIVEEELKNSKYVKNFYPAHPNDGGAGITMIEFDKARK